MNKKQCAVRGAAIPGAMCAQIITGGKLCGSSDKCEHQRIECGACEGLGWHPTGDGGVKCGGCNGIGFKVPN